MIRRFLRALALRFAGVGQLRADSELHEPSDADRDRMSCALRSGKAGELDRVTLSGPASADAENTNPHRLHTAGIQDQQVN